MKNAVQFRDHGLVDHLLRYAKPEIEGTTEIMEEIRADFIALGHKIVDQTPAGPDLTVALRDLHRACMSAIANIALNQDAYRDVPDGI